MFVDFVSCFMKLYFDVMFRCDVSSCCIFPVCMFGKWPYWKLPWNPHSLAVVSPVEKSFPSDFRI